MMIKDGEKVIKTKTKYLSVLCKKRFDQFSFQMVGEWEKLLGLNLYLC